MKKGTFESNYQIDGKNIHHTWKVARGRIVESNARVVKRKKEAFAVVSSLTYGYVYVYLSHDSAYALRLPDARALGLALIAHADNPTDDRGAATSKNESQSPATGT